MDDVLLSKRVMTLLFSYLPTTVGRIKWSYFFAYLFSPVLLYLTSCLSLISSNYCTTKDDVKLSKHAFMLTFIYLPTTVGRV